jgi:hypothetical protein
MTPPNQRSSSEYSAALVAVFLALLVAPALAYALGLSRGNAEFIASDERRVPIAAPPLREFITRTPSYTRRLEGAIADAFPFRRSLIEGYDALKFFGFRESADPSVTRGREGWLFWNIPGYNALARRTDDLESTVEFFRERSLWCAARGAHYALFIAPEKTSVYPEQLPPEVNVAHPTVTERLVPMLRKAGIDVIDPLPAIKAAKRSGDVYDRNDTHWNGRGAYAGYRAIVSDLHIPDAIKPSALVEKETDRPGDLLGVAGIAGLMSDRRIVVKVAHPRARDKLNDMVRHVRATRVDDPRLPTAILFGDSFAQQLETFLAEDFQRTVFMVWPARRPFDEHLVATERPRFVIEEIIERNVLENIASDDPFGLCFASSASEPSPFASLPIDVRLVAGGTLATLDWVNARPLGANARVLVPPGQLTTISGWAVDSPRRRRPSAVFVRVDGRTLRADNCLERPDVARAFGVHAYRQSGFTVRLDLPPGVHRITFDVLSGDGTTLYRGIRPLIVDVNA